MAERRNARLSVPNREVPTRMVKPIQLFPNGAAREKRLSFGEQILIAQEEAQTIKKICSTAGLTIAGKDTIYEWSLRLNNIVSTAPNDHRDELNPLIHGIPHILRAKHALDTLIKTEIATNGPATPYLTRDNVMSLHAAIDAHDVMRQTDDTDDISHGKRSGEFMLTHPELFPELDAEGLQQASFFARIHVYSPQRLPPFTEEQRVLVPFMWAADALDRGPGRGMTQEDMLDLNRLKHPPIMTAHILARPAMVMCGLSVGRHQPDGDPVESVAYAVRQVYYPTPMQNSKN